MKGSSPFYAEDCKSKGMDRDDWFAYGSNLLRLNKDIYIGVKKL